MLKTRWALYHHQVQANRLSVLGAITSTLQILKHYTRTPPNGLIVYSGMVTTDEERRSACVLTLSHSFVNACTCATTSSTQRRWASCCRTSWVHRHGRERLPFRDCNRIVSQRAPQIHRRPPEKHGRGGQSALRFARLRLEKRHNYVRKSLRQPRSCTCRTVLSRSCGALFWRVQRLQR